MIYGYIRVSTDKQCTENQRFEIERYCRDNNVSVDSWVEETVSGTKRVEGRKLGRMLKRMKKGDILICAELSRLGRNLMLIMSILNRCMESGMQVWSIKDNYKLGYDIQSKILAFAFGLAAEIERDLISQRTREALARKKAEGVVLGRPKGSKSAAKKLSHHESEIRRMLLANCPKSVIARKLKVNRSTLYRFLHEINWKNSDEDI